MHPHFITELATWCALVIESLGIGLITVMLVYALTRSGIELLQRQPKDWVFSELRLRLGRGILLGLEILIAADIIYTVAVELTFQTVGVLALVVIIRTFLSFTLEVELTGRWPWQEGGQKDDKEGLS
ncbi:DUF1622 domain-containing protein [Marinospirillum perlucidum]|uniref:DUF1622 domain-containing protein n=1 Tax=Marinospirillum perlucidum TaxID=1982602 RepID=UPI0015B130AA|nr:DUF1622 domain-containing protein [Marinospirillum perlucidum]